MRRRITVLCSMAAITGIALGASSGVAASPHPYVVNGGPSTIAARPYQVAILDVRNPSLARKDSLRCGGSIVAPTIVVTAGHCTYDSVSHGIPSNPSMMRVLTNSASLTSGGQVINVTAIVRHPSYNPLVDPGINDVALLMLSSPVSAKPVQIIASQSDYRASVAGTPAKVSGWGCYQPLSSCQFTSNYPAGLRAATIPLISNSACSAFYAANHVFFSAHASLCAGLSDASFGAPGACFGDSGGPLTIDGVKGQDLLIGIVSWGVDANCGWAPSAYTRVSTYRNWLIAQGVPVTPSPFATTQGPAISPNAIPIAGDFDGDGHGDVLAYVPGRAADTVLRGAANGSLNPGSATSITQRYVPASCDLNNDHKSDLYLYRPGPLTDKALLGVAQPGVFTATRALTINGTYQLIAGDYNHDGYCDFLLYAPGSAKDKLMLGTASGTFHSVKMSPINGTYKPVVGDFNGDGRSDVYWFSMKGSRMWLAAGVGSFASSVAPSGPAGATPIAGDFDGDGRTDILWYTPGRATDVLWNNSATGFHQNYDITINGTYTPTVIDIDGDHHDEIVWQRSDGAISISRYSL